MRHDPDPGALLEPELVETGRHALGEIVELAVGEVAEARGGLVGFVVDADAIAVDDPGAFQMVADGHRCLHGRSPNWLKV